MSGISNIEVKASDRTSSGKNPARRTRTTGRVPAVVYGPGEPGHSIAIEAKDVKTILASPLGRNTVVKLSIDGRDQLAMLKSYQYHPVTRAIEHADFYTVKLDRPVTVQVPFILTGKSKGVASEGGILRQIFRTLPVVATPEHIPAKIELDVTNVGLGEGLHVREIVLPEGVRIKLDSGQTVVTVVAPEKDTTVVPGAPGADAATAAAPAAAAPAGKAPAGGKDAKAPAGAKDAKAPAKDSKKK